MESKKAFLIGVSVLAATIALKSQAALVENFHYSKQSQTYSRMNLSKSLVSPLLLARANGSTNQFPDHFSHSSHSSHSSHYSSHRG